MNTLLAIGDVVQNLMNSIQCRNICFIEARKHNIRVYYLSSDLDMSSLFSRIRCLAKPFAVEFIEMDD